MAEEQLLGKTFDIRILQGSEAAYRYLMDNLTSQYWYHPAVFEDSDLNSLQGESAFAEYKRLSEERYRKAQAQSVTLCSWEQVKSRQIALVLHGNQQNYQQLRPYWSRLADDGYQVDYVQSARLDSPGLYRWDNDGELQLDQVLSSISWQQYEVRVLAGFSAGCNEILRTLLSSEAHCEDLILVAPWMPILDTRLTEVIATLEKRRCRVRIICGRDDSDVAPQVS